MLFDYRHDFTDVGVRDLADVHSRQMVDTFYGQCVGGGAEVRHKVQIAQLAIVRPTSDQTLYEPGIS
jgi:hypothetical protein